jgi:uncharacterized protein YpmS
MSVLVRILGALRLPITELIIIYGIRQLPAAVPIVPGNEQVVVVSWSTEVSSNLQESTDT